MNLKKIITNYAYVCFENIKREKLILKLSQINVDYYDILNVEDKVIVKIKYEDYTKVKKYLFTLNPYIKKVVGIKNLQQLVRKYKLIILGFLCFIMFVFFTSFIIVDVEVIHDDEALVDLIYSELEGRGIKKFSFKKSYEKLEKIKKQIKNNNLDKIDWLEINKVGMKYVIRVEERIITKIVDEKSYCHVIASKDGLIKNSQTYKGELKVYENDYVKKGDILISGDITLNNESVQKVCASGLIYAEVWFDVKIDLPLQYYEKVKTGKKRSNIIINYDGVNHKLFKDRIENYIYEKRLIFDMLGIKIYVQDDYEVKKIKKTYSTKEAVEKAINLAKEKVMLKLGDTDEIISEKVLQKTINDSTISIDIFIVAHQQIGEQIEAKEEALNDT